MSQDRHSFIAFYPSDWLGGTARMTRLHRSVYFDVCLYIWDKAEPCPATELPLMLGDIANWRDLIEDLLAAGKLVRSADGSLVNEKALAEGRKAYELWLKKSQGGKDGAEKTNRIKGKTGSPVVSAVSSDAKTVVGSPVESGPGVPTQNQNQNQTSEDKSSGAVAPNVSRETKQAELIPRPEAPKPVEPVDDLQDVPLFLVRGAEEDFAAALWKHAVPWLVRKLGKADASCRNLLGKWRSIAKNDGALWAVLSDASAQPNLLHLESWVAARLKSGVPASAPAPADEALSPTVRDIIARQKAEKGAA